MSNVTPKRLQVKNDEEQTLFPGVLTEMDVFRAMMRKLGAKGGAANTKAQKEHRLKVMKKINDRKKKGRRA